MVHRSGHPESTLEPDQGTAVELRKGDDAHEPATEALMDEAARRLLAETGEASARLREYIEQTRFRLETVSFQR